MEIGGVLDNSSDFVQFVYGWNLCEVYKNRAGWYCCLRKNT